MHLLLLACSYCIFQIRIFHVFVVFWINLSLMCFWIYVFLSFFSPCYFVSYSYNQHKPKTEVESRVYEVLSHKNWGSSSTLMNQIAADTFDYEKFSVISQLMWESMEGQRPAAWRVVFKGLTLLEHLVKNGSERCVDDARNHGHLLRQLDRFNYYEGTIDRGLGVREKSKIIIEILSDDERVREERMKAKELRRKFGGNLKGVSGGGGGGYSGYGNDDGGWNSGGGGYGESGIGSRKGSSRYDSDDRVGGRYDDSDTRPTSTPTFASLPNETPKKSKKKHKKKKKAEAAAEAPAPAAAEVDLFSFDDPAGSNGAAAPAAAAAQNPTSEEFGSFEFAANTTTTAAAPAPDPFAAAPSPTQNQQQFDAFGNGGAASQQSASGQFGDFSGVGQQQLPMGGGNPNNIMGNVGGVNNNSNNFMMNGGMMQQQSMGMSGMTGGNNNIMSGGNTLQQKTQQSSGGDDDDFGDFADGTKSSQGGGASAGDPMSKLISLDGLTNNKKKNESKINEPIIANAAAATFVQEKDQIQANVQQSTKGSSMSFQGIDGLNKPMGMAGGNLMPPTAMSAPAAGVMGGGGSNAIGMLDPQMMNAAMPTQTQQMNPQQQQQMMMQQQMMANQGMMNPNLQQGGGMGMMNPQQMNMNNGGMMGGTMSQQQPGMMMGGGMMQQPNMMMGGGGQQQQSSSKQQAGGDPFAAFQ